MGSYSAGIQHRSMLSSQESGARDKGIIVLSYHIHFPFLQESHIWDEYCGQSLLHTLQECEASC